MIDNENNVVFELNGSFLKNAGIMGLLRMLECNASQAVVGRDYDIEGRQLKVSKDYLLNENLGKLYVKALVEYYGKNTKFMNQLNQKGIVDSYMKKEEKTKDEISNIIDSINEFAEMLLKHSFESGYEIIKKCNSTIVPDVNTIKQIKKEKEIDSKYKIYCEVYELLQEKDVREILIMKELMYTKINMFYDSISYFQKANLNSDIVECYNKEFILPLRDEIENVKEGKKRCIECRQSTNVVKPISFMNQTDDVNRKKSHYWNQKADAYACPYCSFLYSLVPLGFCFTGKNAVFVNVNTSIDAMKDMMNRYLYREDEDKISEKSKIYRVFTSDIVNIVENGTSNIQVIARMKEQNDYDIKVISRDIIQKFRIAQENKGYKKGLLTLLEPINVKTDTDYINVYDMVIECILNRRSLYYVFDPILILALKNNSSVNYLRYILDLQCIFGGGSNMIDLKQKVDIAFKHGISIRSKISDSKISDKDNSLRGFVYKLENSLTIGSANQFVDSVIRTYGSKGIAIPGFLKDMLTSEEYFNAVGRGYILGLMYEKYESPANNDEMK